MLTWRCIQRITILIGPCVQLLSRLRWAAKEMFVHSLFVPASKEPRKEYTAQPEEVMKHTKAEPDF
jgi:hypothetical protein